MKSNTLRPRSMAFGAVVFLCLLCSGQQPLGYPVATLQGESGQKRIDLDVTNMDVAAVLKIISDTGGWTIVPSKKVTENTRISLWSKGATARQLLDKLCLVHNYVCKEEEGNVISLMTKEEYEQVFGGMTRTFCLNFQKAETIKPLVESSLTKAGKLGIDPWSNTIVVNDTAENLKKVESLVARLDQGFVQKRFQLVHAKAADVAQTIDRIYPKEGSIQIDARTNSLVAFSSEGSVARIEELIAKLDQDNVTKVFQIRFQSATELARQLASLVGSSGGFGSFNSLAPASGAAGVGGSLGPLRAGLFEPIVALETTNQIIATGSAAQVDYLTGLIRDLDSQVVVATIPLKRLKAALVLPQIAHLASKPESIKIDPQGNNLIIRDNSNNVEQIRKILLDLDEALVTKVITLQFALASDVETILRAQVTNPEAFRADVRTNQIVICDSASQVARMEDIIAKLDAEDAYFTRTFHLQHAPATSVAEVVKTFLSSQRPKQTPGAADRGYDSSAVGPEPSAPTPLPLSSPRPSSARETTTPPSPGSAPGLASLRAPARETAPSPATTPTQAPAFPAAGPSSAESLGTAGTVVADDRSNTVTITETLAILTKVEELVQDLDVPVKAYSYSAQCRQLDPAALEKMIPGFLRSKEDKYFVDETTRTIHFTTMPSMAERLIAVLKDWDRPVRQVLIRARIMTVNTRTLRDIGVNFDSVVDIDGSTLVFQGSLPSQVAADRSGSMTFHKLTDTQFQILIRAIEADSRSHVLANPRILAMDNSPAQVRTATDEPFTETSIDAQNGSTIQNVRFLQVGTVLEVTPRIKEDRTIEMDIALDASSLEEIRNGTPVVKRNIAKSNVVVKDNHVLMIGGLRYNFDMKVREKIPILGDIPLLGMVFRSDRKERQETELVLFLQPTIVGSSEGTERPSDPNEFTENSEVPRND
jgi:general secretion pathway protein D